jgi:hypothetical protein
MSTTTTNYQFHKPELTDPADITKLNPNWDKIDTLLAKFIDIPANANLNNYTEIGRYICGINARVSTLSNCPTVLAFQLEVGKHAGIYQRLIEYNASAPKIYFRNRDDTGNWGAWQREYTTVDRPSPFDIGAAPESLLNRTYSVATSTELDNAINTVLADMESHTVREFEISFTAAIQPFGGGTFISKLYKVGDEYAVVEMRVYATTTPKTWIRSLFNGKWKEWVRLIDSGEYDLSEVSKTSITNNVTLSSGSWTTDGTYSISNSYVYSNSIVEIAPRSDITATQLKALQKANIIDGGMTSGTIKLKAMGMIPTVDIPIVTIVRRDT